MEVVAITIMDTTTIKEINNSASGVDTLEAIKISNKCNFPTETTVDNLQAMITAQVDSKGEKVSDKMEISLLQVELEA